MSASSLLSTYLGYGTNASRPASVAPQTGGLAFWYSYDTVALYIWDTNTSAWVAAPGGGGGSGTVTSVGLSLPAIFSVSGSPVTTTGTLTATLATQTANFVWAGPTTGAAAAPTFRALVTADLPSGTTQTIASGTAALGTTAIASGAAATVVTVAATGVATTDVIDYNFNGDPTAVTGYTPSASGMLTIIAYPTANNVNFIVANNTSASITPGAITLNWRVLR